MLVSKNIPNLINGISQQPDVSRMDTQAEDQINAYPSTVEGLTKRMPTEHQAKFTTSGFNVSPNANAFTHFMERDSAERYIFYLNANDASLTGGSASNYPDMRVYDIENGADYPVTSTNANKAYLNALNPSTTFKAMTIADVTFLVNTTKTVAAKTGTTRANPPSNGQSDAADQLKEHDALIFIRQGDFGAKYEITVTISSTTTTISYKTPDGLVSSPTSESGDTQTFGDSERERASTNYIAQRLVATSAADEDWDSTQDATNSGKHDLNDISGITAVQIGSCIYVHGTSAFTITVNDSAGGDAMTLIQDSVQNFTDLPTEARHKFTTKVVGDPDTNIDDYYVEFLANNSGDGKGVWVERDAPGGTYQFDETTMPHILLRTWSGDTPQFEIREADDSSSTTYWNYRSVGDDTTNPFPTFIGEKIKDIFLFKNRLGFLAGESIIMSRAGLFFDFFRSTVTDILDDQPIDVQSAHNKVALMHDAVPFSDRLILFSDHSQFSLSGDPIVTTQSISITATNDYSNLNTASPVPSARSIFFPFSRGGFSGVNEYFPTGDGETFKAIDITAHVPQYISGNILKFAPCTNENVLACMSSGKTDSIYVYNYFTQDNQRVQNAWHRYEFGSAATVIDIQFIQSTLFLVIQRGTEVFIEKMRFDDNAVDSGSDYFTRLDRRVYFAASGSRTTTFTLPYTPAAGRTIEIITTAGERITATTDGTTTVTAAKSLANLAFYAGEAYTMTYQFSHIFVKEVTRSGGQAVIPEGRLQIRYGSLTYADTGAFNVAVTNENSFSQVTDAAADTTTVTYDTDNYLYSGRIIGANVNRLGQVPFGSGKFRFPVFAKNDMASIVITNDTPLPSKLMAAEFELAYNPRTRRRGL